MSPKTTKMGKFVTKNVSNFGRKCVFPKKILGFTKKDVGPFRVLKHDTTAHFEPIFDTI